MKIENMQIAELKPYEKNAKMHTETQIKNVATSIEKYGFVQPLVVDRDGTIVIGHCRYEAAKKLGLAEVPCVCVDELTEEQVCELRILDNKLNESEWDLMMLREELEDLDFDDFDIEFGFEVIDATEKRNGASEIEMEDFSDEKFECECPRCGFRFNK